MSHRVIDVNPAEYITVGTPGEPAEHTLLLQGQAGTTVVTLAIDEEQAAALAIAGGELLGLLEEEYAREIDLSQIPLPANMALRTPFEPLFEVALFQLGYDAERDYLVIITIELPLDQGFDLQNLAVVRFWITREQMIALIREIDDLVAIDQPACPACGQFLEPEGHQCIRMN